jgi:secondary thiamine-phosphate synthase enzyme
VSDEMIATRADLGLLAFHRTLALDTRGPGRLHDLTDDVSRFVDDCAIEAGILVAHSLHTTAGLLLNERESGLQVDFCACTEALVPRSADYRHDDMSVRWENLCPADREAPNGHAHLQHALFGTPGLSVPVADGCIVLGTWQRILLVEYDRPRPREVFLQALGVSQPSRHLPVEG